MNTPERQSEKNKTNTRLSQRAKNLRPFHVMDILAQARAMQELGKSIYHMEVGEPDFSTTDSIVNAGIAALKRGQTHYTPALGLPELRQAIADYYENKFSLCIDYQRIIITPGASGALQLAISCLLDAGDEILMTDPGYPCNRNISEVFATSAVSIPVTAESNYQLTDGMIAANWGEKTRAVIVSSPSNPTGTVISKQQLSEVCSQVTQQGGRLIVDEIYQGLVYGIDDYTALSISDDCFVINSFSKYFGMTGWRVGWMVVPENYVDAIDRIAQNIFLAPATMSQYAAIEALNDKTQSVLDQRREVFQRRRDFLLPALAQIGFSVEAHPQGAFYIYAGCEQFTHNSLSWVNALLRDQGVAITPGIDFGDYLADTHCRLAYTQPREKLTIAVEKIDQFIRHGEHH